MAEFVVPEVGKEGVPLASNDFPNHSNLPRIPSLPVPEFLVLPGLWVTCSAFLLKVARRLRVVRFPLSSCSEWPRSCSEPFAILPEHLARHFSGILPTSGSHLVAFRHFLFDLQLATITERLLDWGRLN